MFKTLTKYILSFAVFLLIGNIQSLANNQECNSVSVLSKHKNSGSVFSITPQNLKFKLSSFRSDYAERNLKVYVEDFEEENESLSSKKYLECCNYFTGQTPESCFAPIRNRLAFSKQSFTHTYSKRYILFRSIRI